MAARLAKVGARLALAALLRWLRFERESIMHLFYILTVYLCGLGDPCVIQKDMGRIEWSVTDCRNSEKEVLKNKVPFPTESWATTCTPKYKWINRTA